MTLAPLTTGPHVTPANRLAFTTPAREAGGAGHWITLGHHGDDEEGGGVHVYIGGGSGPGSGTITKGPKGLLGHHIAALASHPSVSKAQHHPVGHEPPGARDHPHYAEAPPKAPGGGKTDTAPLEAQRDAARAESHALSQRIYSLRDQRKPGLLARAQKDEAAANERLKAASDALYKAHEDNAAEPAKRPGKPYARLHGAEQGTRQEQIGKALSEAQGAAKGAKAGAKAKASGEANPADLSVQAAADHHRAAILAENPDLKAHLDAATSHAPEIERWVNNEARTRLSPQQKAQGGRVLQNAQSYAKPEVPEAGAAKAEDARKAAAEQEATRAGARRMTDAAVERGRKAREKHGIPAPQPHAFEAPEAKVADTAVAHQQAQADLAAHRAKADRNPNPWAPHLSPPVGDAKDRELAEKATRAQMAHQAVVAQQQGQAQAHQQEGQRAHEKEMVRVKAEATQPKPEVTPLEKSAGPAPQKQEPPTAKTEKTLFAQPNYLRDHVATRSEMDLRRDAEGLAGMHQQAVKRQIGMERAGDTTSDAYKANAQHAAMLNKHAAAVNDRLEDSRRKSIAGSESDLRGPERRGGGPHDTLMHDQPAAQPKPLVNPSHARKLDLTPAERAQIEAERTPEPNPPEPLRATPPKQSNLLRDQASPSGKRRVSLEMPTPRPAAGPQSTPAPEQPTAGPPAAAQATPAHAAHEDTLQHLRDHVVARNPVGHSVSPAHVLREMPGATRQEAIAHLDALAQRGVLRQNQHHANFYEVLPGHGASGPGKGDAPAADIRRAQAQPQTAPQPEQATAKRQPEPEHPAISALRNTSGYLQTKYLAPGVMRPSPESSQIIKAHHDPIIRAAEEADPAHPLHKDPDLVLARRYMDESAHKATNEYKAAQRAAPPQVPLPVDRGLPAGHRLVSAAAGPHVITSTADKFHVVNRHTGEALASHDTMAGIKRALAKIQKGGLARKARESGPPTRFSAPAAR